MMNAMTYRGYTARIEYDDADRIFVGRLAGIRDIVGFHASTVDALQSAFHESVDDYCKACEKLGQTPQKPASGKLMLRVPPEVHSAALVAAQASGVSLNQWAGKVLQQAAAHA
ncbi:MAG: antitoxin HicB [Comamonadaceae bacterium CG1_02_60_18]|nr:MAG: antitoxin HicB [Comamonadaceae bacterium CG1_02_60_18]PIQ53893.1 MAG: toxin-antitoxin system HicB family antitoxin [Comamonadaceae bacterium CG12_big_fil_rev_8_21_14_0_65_59_15]